MKEIKKIGVLTGGGDCPGLNAVIRAVTKTAISKYGIEVIGYKSGYSGLYHNDFMKLDNEAVSGILHIGGTILKNSNKDNLFNYPIQNEKGEIEYKDVSDVAVENLKKENVDALVIIGGDGTLTSARDFARKGVNVIGIPKTIDNDVPFTDVTFGYSSALDTIMDALDKLHTTASSHDRILILEVMGRNAGWLALEGGIAGSADVILIPEIPYDIECIVKKIKDRDSKGNNFAIIIISEGALPIGGEVTIRSIVENSPDNVRLGGVGVKLAHALQERLINHEVRDSNLGYLQRGGNTNRYDRVLGSRFGVFAAHLLNKGEFGVMVRLKDNQMGTIPLETVIGSGETGETSHGGGKQVNPEGELVNTARSLGISFGNK